MTTVNVIATKEDYEAGKAQLLALMDENPAEGSEKDLKLHALALLLDDYEKRQNFLPNDDVTPADVIKFVMEQNGLAQKDMQPYIGAKSKVSEILSGKRELTLNMIKRLVNGLGIPAQLLIGSCSCPAPRAA